MGKKKKSKKNRMLQIEKFVVCPNCKRPFFRESALGIKGSARGYHFCGHCGFEVHRAFKGTKAGKGSKIPSYADRTNKFTL